MINGIWLDFDPSESIFSDGTFVVAKWDGLDWNYSVGVMNQNVLYSSIKNPDKIQYIKPPRWKRRAIAEDFHLGSATYDD
jgi:hypothetical protein